MSNVETETTKQPTEQGVRSSDLLAGVLDGLKEYHDEMILERANMLTEMAELKAMVDILEKKASKLRYKARMEWRVDITKWER